MNEHPDRDDLLGHSYDLLDDERTREVDAHLTQCVECQEGRREIMKAMPRSIEQPGAQDQRRSVRHRWLRSPVAPVACMVLCAVGSALANEPAGVAALVPLILGAVVLGGWLYSVLRRLETRLGAFANAGWRAALPRDLEERALFVDGLRLSVTKELESASRRVGAVLITSVLLASLSAALVLVVRATAPEQATAIQQRTFLFPVALAAGLMVTGIIWFGLHLRRLARTVAFAFASVPRAGPLD